MISNLLPSVLGKASGLGVSLFQETAPIQLLANASPEEVEGVIRAIYRQVLGNAHVMESERLTVPESQLKNREITVLEFVRQLAQSELYRNRFFYSCPQLRSIELNFKHLLGRAPESNEELSFHVQMLNEEGYWSEIDSYLNSDEYLDAFGDNTVPYYRGYKTQTGRKLVGFTHMFQLLRGSCSSDLSSFIGNRSPLQRSLLTNQPSKILPLSSPPPTPVTNVQQLIAKALGLQTYPSVSPQVPPSAPPIDLVLKPALQQQYQAFEDVALIELLPASSEGEVETVIRAVYRQVLGNAYVM
ncbi:MAG: phycobilisome Linker polypeptide, partial [Symploca sp. SIO2G7]|nr:phycobilisome Linker polypeptide [Symploca sp. SIO2G7]